MNKTFLKILWSFVICLIAGTSFAIEETHREIEGDAIQNTLNEMDLMWKSQSDSVFTAKVKFRASILFPGRVRSLPFEEVDKILLQVGKMPQKDAFEYLVRHFVNQRNVDKMREDGITFFPIRHHELVFDKDFRKEHFEEFGKTAILGDNLIVSKDAPNRLIYVELPSNYPLKLTAFSVFRATPNLSQLGAAMKADVKIFNRSSVLDIVLTGRDLQGHDMEGKITVDQKTLFVQTAMTRKQGIITNQRCQFFPFYVEKNSCFPLLSVACKYEEGILHELKIYEIEDLAINIPLPKKEFLMDADAEYAVVDRRKKRQFTHQVTRHVEDVVDFIDNPK